MITNVCLLMEALTIVFCLHALHGEKFKLDIETTSFLAINMIIMTIINYCNFSKVFTMIIYPIIALYCGVKFEFKVKIMIMDVIFCTIIVGVIQMVVMMPFGYLLGIQWFTELQLLIVNCLAFIIVVFLLPKCKIYKFMKFLQNKERIQTVIVIICIALVAFWLFSYKEFKMYEFYQALMLFISIICIFVLADQLAKYKIKAKEIETELKMHKLYADSFQGLIDNIRLRQHEFDNHIHTIYSQHYIYDTYDELVKAQDAYCKIVSKENRFNKLLKSTNPIVAGFLYGKFVEIDKMNIDIDYQVKIKELDIEIPVYKIVEILGDLINNAVEAIETLDGADKIYVSLIEDEGFEIEVRNESPIINYDEINAFFAKGFSNKGENRGLGLYNVKNICNEYNLDIYCENITINEVNWLSFKVIKENASSYS